MAMKRLPVPRHLYGGDGLWFYLLADGRKQYGRRIYNKTTGKQVSRVFPGCFDEAEAIELWRDENGRKSKRIARQRQTLRLAEVADEVFARMEKNLARPQTLVKTARQGRRKRGVGSKLTLDNYRADYKNHLAPYFKPSTY